MFSSIPGQLQAVAMKNVSNIANVLCGGRGAKLLCGAENHCSVGLLSRVSHCHTAFSSRTKILHGSQRHELGVELAAV